MKFNGDLAAIHAYLCADGYVLRNPPSQKHKYYYIGLRNTNTVLLKDFQTRFDRFFGLKPIITNDGRAKIQNKEIYKTLTEGYTYYSDRWFMPRLNKELLRRWLRAYFDCDGWVYVMKAKNRKIGLDSINHRGILQIKEALFKKFGIESTLKKRRTKRIWSLAVCSKKSIAAFAKNIGFLHPKKKARLEEALCSYMSYEWTIPKNKEELIKFIKTKGRISRTRGQVRFNSIVRKNLLGFKSALIRSGIKSRISNRFFNGNGRSYYTLSINTNEIGKFGGLLWDMEETSKGQNSRR